MKVMCIKQGEWNMVKRGLMAPHTHPKYGEICTVVYEDHDSYLLEEHDAYYTKRWFIPCSDIEETELINHKEEVV